MKIISIKEKSIIIEVEGFNVEIPKGYRQSLALYNLSGFISAQIDEFQEHWKEVKNLLALKLEVEREYMTVRYGHVTMLKPAQNSMRVCGCPIHPMQLTWTGEEKGGSPTELSVFTHTATTTATKEKEVSAEMVVYVRGKELTQLLRLVDMYICEDELYK